MANTKPPIRVPIGTRCLLSCIEFSWNENIGLTMNWLLCRQDFTTTNDPFGVAYRMTDYPALWNFYFSERDVHPLHCYCIMKGSEAWIIEYA